MHTARKILALKFELESNAGTVELIAWIESDGNCSYLKPTRPKKTLMDVTAGDTVIHNAETF